MAHASTARTSVAICNPRTKARLSLDSRSSTRRVHQEVAPSRQEVTALDFSAPCHRNCCPGLASLVIGAPAGVVGLLALIAGAILLRLGRRQTEVPRGESDRPYVRGPVPGSGPAEPISAPVGQPPSAALGWARHECGVE
jgi:hypothetical protein